MKPLLTILLIFTISLGFSQGKIVSITNYKKDGSKSYSDDSTYYSMYVSMPDSGSNLYNVAEYYKNHKTKLIGKIPQYNMVLFEGPCVSFYETGKRKSTITYKKNLPVGTAYYFFPNGKIYLEREYPDSGSMYNEFEDKYLITANFDSLGTVMVENGNGYYKGYDDKFTRVTDEGSVKNGKKDGIWKGSVKDMKIAYAETYKDGDLVVGSSVNMLGESVSYNKSSRSSPPQFRGGVSDFVDYLGNNIQYPTDARQSNTQGRVIVSFVVEKDGKVSQVKVLRSVSPTIDAEAVRVIKNSPRWKPGKQFGREVSVAYSVPVNFTLRQN
jgi:TonB family protein